MRGLCSRTQTSPQLALMSTSSQAPCLPQAFICAAALQQTVAPFLDDFNQSRKSQSALAVCFPGRSSAHAAGACQPVSRSKVASNISRPLLTYQLRTRGVSGCRRSICVPLAPAARGAAWPSGIRICRAACTEAGYSPTSLSHICVIHGHLVDI